MCVEKSAQFGVFNYEKMTTLKQQFNTLGVARNYV